MPKGEVETHPYLQQGLIDGATKLILGSFPVYACSDMDNPIKQKTRLAEGTVRFFYGSARSRLWRLYRDNIDNSIELPPNPTAILHSLTQRQIAISDTIKSCERYTYKINKKTKEKILFPFSSEDKALHVIEWNQEILTQLIDNGTRKILCTSKGVLRDLERQIICKGNHPPGQVDNGLSVNFQSSFIKSIGGNEDQIANSIAKVFLINNFQVSALAIPSPGSPQRQITQFGFNGLDWRSYAESYFAYAFAWLVQ